MELTRTRPPAQSPPARGITSQSEVLAVAEEVFAAKGFAGASLDDIAAPLGIRRPSLLHYYPSKRVLYDAVEKNIFDALAARIAAIPDAGDPFERLIALLTAWLDFMSARPTAARIILRNTADLAARADNPTAFSEVAVAAFEDLVAAGIAKGAFRPVEPMHLIHIVSTSLLHFICNAESFGPERAYDHRDPATRAKFLTMISETVHALLSPRA